ncbi:hypothetical protein KR018_002987 [Drosophila ironensis]|nr:hypothetical protein KR018_002987 [Drosophila ironensis]
MPLLKFFYIYGMAGGLVPAPLGRKVNCRRIYLIYTACLHITLLLLLPLTFPQFMYDASYMSRNLVLQWAFNLTNITRIMAMLSGFVLIWLKRKKLLELENALITNCLACQDLEGDSTKYTELRRRILGLLWQQFCLLNLSILVATLLLMRIDTDDQLQNLSMILVHVLQFFYVVIMTAAVHVVLVLIYWQQERVNLSLQDLYYALNHEERNSLVLSRDIGAQSLQLLRKHYHLHSSNQQLLRKFLKVLDLPIAMLLLKMFVTNVNLVYHGVQFGSASIETTYETRILGQLVVISHYWSAILLMNIVDAVTRSSNPKTGGILKQFSHLELVRREFHLELEMFSDSLRCHPVTYKVCGLFVFNKQTSMAYFFFVLVQVLVLMQFDMKNKQTGPTN